VRTAARSPAWSVRSWASRAAALAGALAAALLLAACGGGEGEPGFRDKALEISDRVVALRQDVDRSVAGVERAGDRENERTFRALTARSVAIERDLGRLDAPGDADDAVEDLERAVRRGSGNLRQVAEASGYRDPTGIASAVQRLRSESRGIDGANRALRGLLAPER
jgi:hypothetical protein